MKLATWNVNSIKARIGPVLEWLKDASPDLLALQEIKTVDEGFPREAFEEIGYNCAVHGQKTYNGVAILSKKPLEDISAGLPGDKHDTQARYLEATVQGDNGPIKVASIYLPNGNPVGTDKFQYKLSWMDRLKSRAKFLLESEEPVVLMGDYNVIPRPEDCHDPKAWADDALFQPEPRARLRTLEHLGYTDAFRALHEEPHQFTFWDYQGGAWQRNKGIRIDHILLSPQAADRLRACEIDKNPRAGEKPSDHVPVWCELSA